MYGRKLQVSGMAILGTPVPSLGHNRYLSIAMTSGGPDTSDVFEEEINPDNPHQYRYDGQWRDINVRTEKIGIRQNDKLVWQDVKIESTHHGPIVVRKGNKAYAAAIPYYDEVKLVEQIYAMMTAHNLDDMKQALGMLQLMMQNVMIGTVQGDIYYLRNGRVPIRPAGYDYSRPVPGNTSATEWKGIHPLSDLMQITNPPQGYMQNCNNSPVNMIRNSPLTRDSVKERPYLYNEGDNIHQRAAMVLDLLEKDDSITLEDAFAIAASTQVYKADAWQELLRKAGSPQDNDARILYTRILEWNRMSAPDSIGALAFKYFKDALGAGLSNLVDPQRMPEGTLGIDKLHPALTRAAKRMRETWGTLDIKFGDQHRVGRRGADQDYPVGGGSMQASGMSTPRSVGFIKVNDKKLLGVSGQTSTQVVILSNPPVSYTYVPLGQSDRKDSPHYDDQARELFSPGKFKSTYFMKKGELLKHVKSTRKLTWSGLKK
jgi:acyl-homoserine lactone acylase PvdQ